MLELHPESYDTHFGAGIAYAQMAMYKEAIAELQKALDLSGQNASAWAWLAYSYIATE
jgi:Flp pilus assembly protein TadD